MPVGLFAGVDTQINYNILITANQSYYMYTECIMAPADAVLCFDLWLWNLLT